MCIKLQKANSFTSNDNEDVIDAGKPMPRSHVQNKSGGCVIAIRGPVGCSPVQIYNATQTLI